MLNFEIKYTYTVLISTVAVKNLRRWKIDLGGGGTFPSFIF